MRVTRLVLDCSVAASWLFEDEADPLGEEVLDHLEEGQAIVPPIWPVEIAAVLAGSVRRKRMNIEDIETSIGYLRKFDIAVDSLTVDPVLLARLALASGLSVYDAMYLELARRHALPLATLDKKLSAAARQNGVQLYESAVHKPPVKK